MAAGTKLQLIKKQDTWIVIIILFQTDYEVALELLYALKLGSIMARQLPAPLGCFIVS